MDRAARKFATALRYMRQAALTVERELELARRDLAAAHQRVHDDVDDASAWESIGQAKFLTEELESGRSVLNTVISGAHNAMVAVQHTHIGASPFDELRLIQQTLEQRARMTMRSGCKKVPWDIADIGLDSRPICRQCHVNRSNCFRFPDHESVCTAKDSGSLRCTCPNDAYPCCEQCFLRHAVNHWIGKNDGTNNKCIIPCPICSGAVCPYDIRSFGYDAAEPTRTRPADALHFDAVNLGKLARDVEDIKQSLSGASMVLIDPSPSLSLQTALMPPPILAPLGAPFTPPRAIMMAPAPLSPPQAKQTRFDVFNQEEEFAEVTEDDAPDDRGRKRKRQEGEDEDVVIGKGGRVIRKRTCGNCGRKGHYLKTCKRPRVEADEDETPSEEQAPGGSPGVLLLPTSVYEEPTRLEIPQSILMEAGISSAFQRPPTLPLYFTGNHRLL